MGSNGLSKFYSTKSGPSATAKDNPINGLIELPKTPFGSLNIEMQVCNMDPNDIDVLMHFFLNDKKYQIRSCTPAEACRQQTRVQKFLRDPLILIFVTLRKDT
jgi:hypothetical protein